METEPNDIYAKAEAELTNIDSQLAKLERRRDELRQFVELGRRLYAGTGSERRPTGTAIRIPRRRLAEDAEPPSQAGAFIQRARELSLKASVLQLSEQAISERGPTHTRELIDYIESRGVQITGSDKTVTVSVILSRSDRFASDRTRGWTLKQETPQDAPTSTGSSAA